MFRQTFLLLSLLSAPVALAADSLGTAGTVDVIDVNATTADTYLQFHGRVFLTVGAQTVEYRWGGTSCSNKTLSEGQVAMLQRASESGMLLTPRYQSGQGLHKCLVGFTIRVP